MNNKINIGSREGAPENCASGLNELVGVSGNTYKYRNYMKRLGLRYIPASRMWVGSVDARTRVFLSEKLSLQVRVLRITPYGGVQFVSEGRKTPPSPFENIVWEKNPVMKRLKPLVSAGGTVQKYTDTHRTQSVSVAPSGHVDGPRDSLETYGRWHAPAEVRYGANVKFLSESVANRDEDDPWFVPPEEDPYSDAYHVAYYDDREEQRARKHAVLPTSDDA
jgi:hypothetical protein